ncbi:MAG: AMP-binding protein [Deltaproteobacteria bacterium]|nr:AMP-binding protein [Deltaproteobacteria bacterium]
MTTPARPISGGPLPGGDLGTLVEAFLSLDGRPGRWMQVGPAGSPRPYTGGQVVELARRWRRALQEAGVRPGSRVAILLPNDERFVGAFFGAWLCGAAAVPLAWPATTLDARRVVALRPLVEAADPAVIVTDEALADHFPVRAVTHPDSVAVGHDVLPAPGDTAFIQFTSGSLGRPKGAVITHAAAAACVYAMGHAVGASEADVAVSWLPLFHDMGLVGGLLTPVAYRFPVTLLSPGEFLLHPGRWLDRAAAEGITTAAAPDFAWRLCTRRVGSVRGSLSSWRVAISGAEPVHRSTLDAFVAKFRSHGFGRDTFRPAYGLAENTLAACIYDPARPEGDASVHGRAIPSVGAPIAGNEIRVVDADGRDCPEGQEGEIRVRSASLMSGYFRDEAASAAALVDGWLRTGDLGVVTGGQLHVSGRAKELVIQNGSKFHPYDIERVATDAVDATVAGAAAYVLPTGEGEILVLAAEVPASKAEGADRRIRGAVLEALGVRIDRVVVVAPGSLPRTSSGKIRRVEVPQFVEASHGA